MASKTLIDTALKLYQSLGGNVGKILGTRTNVNFLGKGKSSFRKLKESKMQTIKLTMTEDKIIPSIPKLNGEIFPKFFVGAPIKNQSKKALSMIPANDN